MRYAGSTLLFSVRARRLICAVLVPGALASASLNAAPVAEPAVDQLLVVDCLLPGQVRRLGQHVTYLSSRKAVKTSAGDCAIRGGEYVAYDRADYRTALNVWLPLAQQGDAAAQTYVGEIYEKGLGIAPDYRAAAEWYGKAAEQGHARAQINLGFLNEKGLGIDKNPGQALTWYRKAAGLNATIALDGGAAEIATQNAEIATLRRELQATHRHLEQARQELTRQKHRSQSEIRSLKNKQQQAARAGQTAVASDLAGQLTRRETELKIQEQRVIQLENSSHVFLAQIALLQQESGALKLELDTLRQNVGRGAVELKQRRQESQNDQEQTQSLRREIVSLKERVAASVDRGQVTALDAELRAREAGLHAKEAALTASRAEIARLEQVAAQQQALIAKLETAQNEAAQRAAVRPTAAAVVAYAVPSIQLIDPPVMVMRGNTSVAVRGGVRRRDIVGRVTAPAGLLSLTVNDRGLTPDKNGLFRSQIELQRDATPVRIVAVDSQGKRVAMDFSMVTEAVAIQKPSPLAQLPRSEFGNYYALVIGNEKYSKLPSLDTAAVDAKAVAKVLTDRYGFKVSLLINATRYQTLSELNKMRAQLTEKDNLLIYYAGHGELDRVNLRGHWLPVDAEPNSDANWISSVAVTDILNAMSAKHVLVVADSCYAGAMTRSAIARLDPGMSEETRITWLRALAKTRSRTVFTSGGLQPVIDGGGGGHSIFAKQFLQVLTANQDPIEAQRLYNEVSARVLSAAVRLKQDQRPEYAPLKFAGHESGDFLFIPVN